MKEQNYHTFMKNTRRTSLQIRREMLNAIKEGETVATRMAHKTRISGVHVKKELEDLIDRECIICIQNDLTVGDSRKKYFLTEKGEALLNILKETKTLLDI